jgi:microcystin-dependent protein
MMQRLRFPLAFLALAILLFSLPRRARALDLLIDVLAVGVTDNLGVPLSLGKVTFYDAGTTNLRTVYQDFGLTTPAANPVILDTAGRAIVYTSYRVKLVITDSADGAIRTIDNVGSADADVASSAQNGGLAVTLPIGIMLPYGGTGAVPSGWLYCDGAQYSQAQYAALYAVIGTSFNTGGETAGYFRVPAQARRALVGAGGSGTGTLGNAVGNRGGAETHTLTGAESGVPAHGHTFTPPTCSTDTTGSTHVHTFTYVSGNADPGAATDVMYGSGGGLTGLNSGNPRGTAEGSHTHGCAISGGAVVNASAATAGSAHNNVQPSLVTNFIIKY